MRISRKLMIPKGRKKARQLHGEGLDDEERFSAYGVDMGHVCITCIEGVMIAFAWKWGVFFWSGH